MSSVHDYNRAEVPGRSTRSAMTTSALLTTAATLLTSAAVLLATVTPQARASSTRGVRKAFSWQAVSWAWPEQPAAADALRAGYTPHTNLPHGLEVWRDRLFLTVPRRKAGVPATLGYVTVHRDERAPASPRSPPLSPYPDWETQRLEGGERAEGESARITSAYRVRADACDRLWVMDAGTADLGQGALVRLTRPQLLVYDLRTDTLLLRYYLRRDDFDATSFFASIAVDVEGGHCGEAFAYLPDLGSSALVVFSLSDRSSRRLRHNFFRMDPLYGDFDIAGFNYQLADGIFSVALSAPDPEDDGYRTAFFHALCSSREFAVSSRWLRNSTAAGTTSWFRSFQPVGSRGDRGQSTGSFLDERTGVLFMMEVLNHRVTCWNSRSGLPMDAETIGVVAEDDGTSFIYPSDVKVDASRNELWFLTNVYPVLLLGRINTTEYNYHIFTGAVDDAVRDTPCEPARDATGSGHWRRYQAEAASPVSPSLVMEAAGPQ
ncbi:L-dopachrome tautomerase yellow-f2-like [Schistocerca nitens]|uniref:L-dopachrome tautomerase yellow-f2-like n=1 Tax=Schistocerca nitens TaxID=7011 RepID=UPI0021180C74|nr:L-dopachrome tautomerase yellow-f2-like [Schistocerca nitens]